MSAKNYIQFDLKPAIHLENFTLCHAGKSVAHGEIYVPFHKHSCYYELTVVLSGKGVSYTSGIATPVKQGDIYVSFPYENHQIDSDPADFLSYCFICFDVKSPKYASKLKSLWFDHVPPENRIIKAHNEPMLIQSILDELANERGKYFEELLDNILEQITLFLLRGMSDRLPASLSGTPTDKELCKHVSHYIDTHLFTMKKLPECAKALSYNYSYLSTVFKKTTGITLSDYYKEKKLEMAKFLIVENESSISEIAERLGYSGISAFSKAFSAKFKMSPREFSKKLHEVG